MSQLRGFCKLILFLEVLEKKEKRIDIRRLGAALQNANYIANIYHFKVNKKTCAEYVAASWCLYC